MALLYGGAGRLSQNRRFLGRTVAVEAALMQFCATLAAARVLLPRTLLLLTRARAERAFRWRCSFAHAPRCPTFQATGFPKNGEGLFHTILKIVWEQRCTGDPHSEHTKNR